MKTRCGSRRAFSWFVAAFLGLLLVRPVAAQTVCAGDCGRDGEVTVDEILALVAIALGSGEVATCAAGDRNADGQITVDEIVAALQNALDGCPQSATQTWVESDFRIVEAACPADITGLIESQLGSDEACASEITIDGDLVTAVDCDGSVTEALIGDDGIARVTEIASEQIDDCLLTIELNVSVDLRRSPTSIEYDVNVDSSGNCPFPRCEIVFASTLTRQ